MAVQNSVEILTSVPVEIDEPAVRAEVPPRRPSGRLQPDDSFHKTVALLARALLDVRSAREAELRALTAMQRYLETIRADACASGESQLLLGEIERQLATFCAPGNQTQEMLCSAVRHLEQLRAFADSTKRDHSNR